MSNTHSGTWLKNHVTGEKWLTLAAVLLYIYTPCAISLYIPPLAVSPSSSLFQRWVSGEEGGVSAVVA